jgi:large subunit ribosomal protein L25
MDLTRVMEDDTVEIDVTIELRGTAPGISSGGVVNQAIYSITLECPVMEIPEKLEVNINELQLEEVITVADIEIPANCTLITDPVTLAVQCVQRMEEEEEEVEGDDVEGTEDGEHVVSAEPELIGRAEDDADDESEDE